MTDWRIALIGITFVGWAATAMYWVLQGLMRL